MNQTFYSKICDHTRLKRIDDNFVRCAECGLSMISHKKAMINKTKKEFENENGLFMRNFDRNFTNTIEEKDEKSTEPIYKYYADKHGVNKIIINQVPVFNSYPNKFQVFVNDSSYYLFGEQIQKILLDTNAQEVNGQGFIIPSSY